MSVTAFELERLARIESNRKRMLEMGIVTLARELKQTATPVKKITEVGSPMQFSPRHRLDECFARRARPRGRESRLTVSDCCAASSQGARRYERRPVTPESERRRSSRERAPVSYAGMDDGSKDADDVTFRRVARVSPTKTRAPRATYSVGGRVYDSELGVTCHWCRQKTVETHVTCVGEACAGARLPLSFCGMCLRNRHGEDIDAAVASGCWTCPRCRGSCGEGCVTCCNCGPCRKKAGLSPTHQVIQLARASGFDNVHDYLVSQETGEGAEEIAARKLTFSWGRWLRDDFVCRPVEPPRAPERRVNVAAGSSAEEDDSALDVQTTESDSEDASSESDDEAFMVVQRTPKKRPATSVSSDFPETPAKKSRPEPSPKKNVTTKKAPSTKKMAPSTPEPLRALGEDVYEFERVLARRKRGRGEQLLIKWRGFGEDEATWEPAKNIICA